LVLCWFFGESKSQKATCATSFEFTISKGIQSVFESYEQNEIWNGAEGSEIGVRETAAINFISFLLSLKDCQIFDHINLQFSSLKNILH
jgi:hypothetical protein